MHDFVSTDTEGDAEDDSNSTQNFSPRDMYQFYSLENSSSMVSNSVSSSNSFQSSISSPLASQPFRKSKWTPEEDKLLIESVKRNGMSNWSLVAVEVPGRTGKQCRERWTNQLCPALNRDTWTHQEDQILIKQQQIHGNLWSKIARFLPGRSANSVKNRWSWLSRHRVPTTLASQMIPFMIQQPVVAQRSIRPSPPPMPQIYQIQQTAPMHVQWCPGSVGASNRLAFSDPNGISPELDNSFSGSGSMLSFDDANEGLSSQSESVTHKSVLDSLGHSDNDSLFFTQYQDEHETRFWDSFE